MRDQYRSARRVYGSTAYPNLWFIEEHPGFLAMTYFDDPNATPATVDLKSVAKDSGWRTPAYSSRKRLSEGDSWWGWAHYCTDGTMDPLEHATKPEAIEELLREVGGTFEEPEENAGPLVIAVRVETLFNGHGLRVPFSNFYTCTGPDGRRFDNKSIRTLRDVLRRRYGKLYITIDDQTDRSNPAAPRAPKGDTLPAAPSEPARKPSRSQDVEYWDRGARTMTRKTLRVRYEDAGNDRTTVHRADNGRLLGWLYPPDKRLDHDWRGYLADGAFRGDDVDDEGLVMDQVPEFLARRGTGWAPLERGTRRELVWEMLSQLSANRATALGYGRHSDVYRAHNDNEAKRAWCRNNYEGSWQDYV